MPVTFFVALGILTAGDIAVRMKAEPKTVAEFYEAYKRYGLWLPPKDAKLVVRRLHDEDNDSILVAERTVNSPAILRDLHGPSTEWLSARFRTIKPDVKIIDEPEPFARFTSEVLLRTFLINLPSLIWSPATR